MLLDVALGPLRASYLKELRAAFLPHQKPLKPPRTYADEERQSERTSDIPATHPSDSRSDEKGGEVGLKEPCSLRR